MTNAATATPARIRDVVVRPPTVLLRTYVAPTAAMPPTKATIGMAADPASKPDHCRRSKTGAGGHTEQIRIGERVPKHTLVPRPGHRQDRPDQTPDDDTRHPQLEEEPGLDLAQPVIDRHQRQSIGKAFTPPRRQGHRTDQQPGHAATTTVWPPAPATDPPRSAPGRSPAGDGTSLKKRERAPSPIRRSLQQLDDSGPQFEAR